jgi:hypothetical protein
MSRGQHGARAEDARSEAAAGSLVTAMSRRQVLVAGAALPLVWTAPQIVTMTSAYADRHSAPPSTPPVTRTDAPVFSVPRAAESSPRVSAATGSLPYTGDSQFAEVAVGAGAVLAGAAVLAAIHETRGLA